MGRVMTTFTFRVDDELKSAFADAARAQDRTAAQLLRTLMRDTVRRAEEARNHDGWFRDEVALGLREAEDPATGRVPHDVAEDRWRAKRADLAKRTGGKTA